MNRYHILMGIVAVTLAAPTAWGAVIAYEGFDYPSDDTALDGKTGGVGWTAPWVSTSSPLSVNGDGNSLDSPVYPFTSVGDRAYSQTTAQGGGAGIAVREFAGIDLTQDGNVLFASFLMTKIGDPNPSTGGNNVEFDLGVDGGTTIRFGSTSGHAFFLNAGDNSTGTVELETTYMMVLKVSSSATEPDLVEASFFGPSDTLPTTEPTTWALTASPDSNAMINTARLWIGASAEGSIDEVRLGETWTDVTRIPEPTTGFLLVLGMVGFCLIRQQCR